MDKLMTGLITGDISPETALLGVALVADKAKRETRECEDCEGIFNKEDGRTYKYEPSIWLCDDCHDERMEDD